MKSPTAICMAIALAGILPAAGKSPELSSLGALGNKLAGGPVKPVNRESIATELQSLVQAEKFAPAVDLSRKVDSYEKMFSALTGEALKEKWDWNSPRFTALASAFSAFFSKLDSVIEEDYKWQSASINASPPPGVPMAAAGMDPKGIQDPELRRQYEATIAAGQAMNLKNSQQTQLTLARELTIVLARVLLMSAKEQGIEKKILVEAIAPAGKSKEMLLELMARTGFK